jgi:predicted O-methyltransferase YrrM
VPASPRDRLRALAARATAGAAARLGLDVVPKSAYSPLADVPAASDPSWSRRMDLPGVRFDLDAQAAFVREALREHLAAFAVPPPFVLDNPFYGPGDAELLFALMRHARPSRVLELGSGWSTHVARAAAPESELVAVDPEPQLALPPGVRHERAGAGELPLDRFAALEASDMLFVDTSHVVKRGSEVNRIVLGVLPRLHSGVLVHFHDVFLPYDYPRLFFELGGHFSEQYLLAAMLTGNDEWEVVLAAHALWRDRPDALTDAIPSLRHPGPVGPSSFWLRRA